MSAELTFAFFLWRRQGTTPEEFADYYNHRHLELLTSLGIPLPAVHERSFPVTGDAIVPAGPREGIYSFDSFTAVAFDSEEEYEARLKILSDESIRSKAEADEDRFTQRALRMTYATEAERRQTPEYAELAASAVFVLAIGRRRPGLDRAEFKRVREAEIAAAEALPGELRYNRYYVLPEHPFSYSRGAWGDEPKTAIDVVEELAFRTEEDASRGLEAFQARESAAVDRDASVMLFVWRASGTPQGRG